MSNFISSRDYLLPERPTLHFGDRLLRRMLRGLDAGSLQVILPDGRHLVHEGVRPGPDAVIRLERWRVLWRLLLNGDLGLADAFADGDWVTPDLAALLTYGSINLDGLNSVSGGWPMRWLHRMLHALRANTRRGSRRNIVAHYDLSNAFYAAWLDPGMTYSSALYTDPDQTLEDAQRSKENRAFELLDVKAGQSVLEIGCGWGGMAERLVSDHDTHVTGLTLSNAQLDYARSRIAQGGLAEKATFRLMDYRDATGTYDRILSIEMLEAVGEAFWPTYFQRLRDMLRPGGVALLQVITIDEARYESYRASPDFIQLRIFPGGMLPTRTIMRARIEQAGLRLAHMEHFGLSYARTLAEWSRRFVASSARSDFGFDAGFLRRWRYYLAYCEAGFRSGLLDVGFYRITHESNAA